MTVTGIIERTDALFPNVYPFPVKARWLFIFDKRVAGEFISRYTEPPVLLDEDRISGDRELFLPEEFSAVYENYLIMEMELHSGNITGYGNRAALFNSEYLSFMKHYNRTHSMKSAKISID